MRTASLRLQADTRLVSTQYRNGSRAHRGSYEITRPPNKGTHPTASALSESVGGNCTEAEIEMLMLLGDTQGQYHFLKFLIQATRGKRHVSDGNQCAKPGNR